MYFYLGPLGGLRELPPIERDQQVAADADAPLAEHVSLTGARIVDRMGPHRRVWDLSWVYLTPDEVDEIDSLRRGLLGTPLWLIDPQRPNLATPQVATAGTERRSTDGWRSQAGARRWVRLPAAARPTAVRAVGAIEWERATVADFLDVGFTTPANRTPVAPGGGPVSVAGYLRRTTASAVQVQIGVEQFDAAGNYLRLTQGPPITLTQNTWVDMSYTHTPAADVASFAPYWFINAGQPASIHQVTGVRCGYGTQPPAPSVGGGAAQVYPRAMPENYPSLGEIDTGITLVEM